MVVLATVAYEDPYVQPLVLSALEAEFAAGSYQLNAISSKFSGMEDLNQPSSAIESRGNGEVVQNLFILPYESLPFHLLDPTTETRRSCSQQKLFLNSYVIRKALIRKHHLSHTIASWTAKNPHSALKAHYPPFTQDFELDYAEFLDDALVEAFELRASFEKNLDGDGEEKPPDQREWWILKPGMSDGGKGIRLFSKETDLRVIFERWEAENPDSDLESDAAGYGEIRANGHTDLPTTDKADHIMTSHLRHFIAQPYIHPPLLIPDYPFNNRKFHIRTYAVAAGALKVFVYSHKLALFASEPYKAPWEMDANVPSSTEASPEADGNNKNDLLDQMRNIHLTNTCMQTAKNDQSATCVFLLGELPLAQESQEAITSQIHDTVSDLFRAALAQPIHFQPLPEAFEIYGLDFLVAENGSFRSNPKCPNGDGKREDSPLSKERPHVYLLEVNAFPDFAQTGPQLRDLIVKGLWEQVTTTIISPYFNVSGNPKVEQGIAKRSERLFKVLDVDMGRG